MDEDNRITIGAQTFELHDWPVDKGLRWLFRLLKAMAPAIGHHELEGAAVGAVVAGLSEEDFLGFVNLAIDHTSLVALDSTGRELVTPLRGEAAIALRRSYHVALGLAIAHGKRQYASFFDNVSGLMGQLGAEARTKS